MMDILHEIIKEHKTIKMQRDYIIALELMLKNTCELLSDEESILHEVKETILQMADELLESGQIDRY